MAGGSSQPGVINGVAQPVLSMKGRSGAGAAGCSGMGAGGLPGRTHDSDWRRGSTFRRAALVRRGADQTPEAGFPGRGCVASQTCVPVR